jgi:hypothetical protein
MSGTYIIGVGKGGTGAGVTHAVTPSASTLNFNQIPITYIYANPGGNALNSNGGSPGVVLIYPPGTSLINGGTGGTNSNGNPVIIYPTSTGQVYVPIPFTSPNINLYVGGGGGAGGFPVSAGGAAGLGSGGAYAGNSSSVGANAINTFSTSTTSGYGGGGGGSGYSATLYNGGNGGNGVVMIWFTS